MVAELRIAIAVRVISNILFPETLECDARTF
jgi:hypothetical protein